MKRRGFLRTIAATGVGAAAVAGAEPQAGANPQPAAGTVPGGDPLEQVQFPRTFTGRRLSQIAFPLGGIGTGSISLGGRGQLQDWEIFNRSDKGQAPEYGFAAICVQSGKAKPVARVLEARLVPPYKSSHWSRYRQVPPACRVSGARNSPGNSPWRKFNSKIQAAGRSFARGVQPVHSARRGEFRISVAVLRYKVRNPPAAGHRLDRLLARKPRRHGAARSYAQGDGRDARERISQRRRATRFPDDESRLEQNSPLRGSFALALAGAGDGR